MVSIFGTTASAISNMPFSINSFSNRTMILYDVHFLFTFVITGSRCHLYESKDHVTGWQWSMKVNMNFNDQKQKNRLIDNWKDVTIKAGFLTFLKSTKHSKQSIAEVPIYLTLYTSTSSRIFRHGRSRYFFDVGCSERIRRNGLLVQMIELVVGFL